MLIIGLVSLSVNQVQNPAIKYLRSLLILFSLIFILPNVTFSEEKENQDDKILIMKALTVEGELDKPAIIIVPRAKLYKMNLFNKSFHNEILSDLKIDYSQTNMKRIEMSKVKRRKSNE